MHRILLQALILGVLLVQTAAGADITLTSSDVDAEGRVRFEDGQTLNFTLASDSWPWPSGNTWHIQVVGTFANVRVLEEERTIHVKINETQRVSFLIPVVAPDAGKYSNGPFEIKATLSDGTPSHTASFQFGLVPRTPRLLTVENGVLAAVSLGWLLWMRRAFRALAALAEGIERLEARSGRARGRIKRAFQGVRRQRVRVVRDTVGFGLLGGLLVGQALRAAGMQTFALGDLLLDALAGILGATTLTAFVLGLLRPTKRRRAQYNPTPSEPGPDSTARHGGRA